MPRRLERKMILAIAAGACLGAMIASAEAQSLGDTVVLRYVELKKSSTAAKFCAGEEGRMQIERNDHYDAFLHANAKNPDAPTIEEMSQALAQTRLEDEALGAKREECAPLLEQLAGAVRELRRSCAAYTAPSANDVPTLGTDTLAINICRGSAKSADADRSGQ